VIMKEFTIDEIQNAMENLAPAIQDSFISIDLEVHLEKIVKMYGLKEEVGTSLFNDVAYVMIGLADKSYFEEHFREALKDLPETTLVAIGERITDEIFIPFEKGIQEYLIKKGIYDEENEESLESEGNKESEGNDIYSEGNTTSNDSRDGLNSKQISQQEMIQNQQISVLKSQGINILDTPEDFDYEGFPKKQASLSPASSLSRLQAHMPALVQDSEPSRQSLMDEIEHPHNSQSFANTPTNSLVQSKFQQTHHVAPSVSDQSIGIQRESLIHSPTQSMPDQKIQTQSMPAPYSVDPYHEPIE